MKIKKITTRPTDAMCNNARLRFLFGSKEQSNVSNDMDLSHQGREIAFHGKSKQSL
jgi:hypothetical protein